MRLWGVCLVVHPPQGLGDAQTSPFLLQQDSQCSCLWVEIVLWYHFQHVFGQHNMSVFIRVVAVSGTVVNHVQKLEHLGSLCVGQVSWPAHNNSKPMGLAIGIGSKGYKGIDELKLLLDAPSPRKKRSKECRHVT